VLHRVRPSLVAELAELQARLLMRAADWVKPGGTLVYATCSLEPDEGERQLERFLTARGDYTVVPAADLPVPVDPAGHVRTLAGMIADGGNDGFFVVKLVRA